MDDKELLEIIDRGECHTTYITKDVYESICVFSNRDGGNVFLGTMERYLALIHSKVFREIGLADERDI